MMSGSLRRHLFGPIAIAVMLQAIAPKQAGAADAKAGLRMLQSNCTTCHAVKAGQRSAHRDAPAFGVVAKRYPPAMLAEALAEGIDVGHPDMPKFIMSPKAIDDVIAYLETLR